MPTNIPATAFPVRVSRAEEVVLPESLLRSLGLFGVDGLVVTTDGGTSLQIALSDPLTELEAAFAGVYAGMEATAYVRKLRDE